MIASNEAGIHGVPLRGTDTQVLASTNPLVIWAFSDLNV
jgi:hypothetical protein